MNTPRAERLSPFSSSSKMHPRALIPLFLGALFLIFLYLFLGTIDVRSHVFPRVLPTAFMDHPLPCKPNSPLKVFMYDLPRRFNIGMLRRSDSDQELPWRNSWVPPWPHNSGLKKQHSVEYWMMASLIGNETNGEEEEDYGGEAVRVLNPEQADVFFVPFFSSLSFNTHGHNMTDPDTEIDRALQTDLLEILHKSKYWEQSGGRDHVIPLHHPNSFRFLRDQVNASILIVADFGRYLKNVSFLRKDVVAPYVHVVDSFTEDDPADPFESRPMLLFFRGRTVRKDEGIVRSKLAKILAGHEDVHYEESVATGEGIKAPFQVWTKFTVRKFGAHQTFLICMVDAYGQFSWRIHLWARGFVLLSYCILCGKSKETVDYLFLGCEFASGIWKKLFACLGLTSHLIGTFREFFKTWEDINCSRRGRILWKLGFVGLGNLERKEQEDL